MKKWLEEWWKASLFLIVSAIVGLTAGRWFPKLLTFAHANQEDIQNFTNLFTDFCLIVGLLGPLWKFFSKSKSDQNENKPSTSGNGSINTDGSIDHSTIVNTRVIPSPSGNQSPPINHVEGNVNFTYGAEPKVLPIDYLHQIPPPPADFTGRGI